MGTRINTAAYERFNASFGKFVEDKNVKDSTIAKFDSKFSLSGVRSLKAGTGDYKGNLFRSAKQIAENNSARAQFMKAVADIFGGESHIPESVKAAMKLDDFDGKGRPLTARRIRATWNQIKAEQKAEQKAAGIRDALKAEDCYKYIKASPDVKRQFDSYVEQVGTDLCKSMEKLFLSDIRKGIAPSAEKIKTFYMSALVDSEKASGIIRALEKANDEKAKNLTALNDKEQEQVCDLRAIRTTVRTRAMCLAMTKNVELADFFFSPSKASNTAALNFKETYADLFNELEQKIEDSDHQEDIDAYNDQLDLVKYQVAPIETAITTARAFYVMGMPQREAVSELMRLSGAEANKKTSREFQLSEVLMMLKSSPVPTAKAILTDYFKQLGKQIVDGTLRKRDKTQAYDQLYIVVLNDDFWHVMADCAKNNEWLMGSKEQDKTLFVELKKQLGEAGLTSHILAERLGLDKLFAE